MKKVIIIFLIFNIFSCVEKKKYANKGEIKTVDSTVIVKNNFDLIQNFETNKTQFTTDTFELNDYSTDGGELIVFHSSKIEYLVLNFWL